MPPALGGLGGGALFIGLLFPLLHTLAEKQHRNLTCPTDTEGSFSWSRYKEVVAATVGHAHACAPSTPLTRAAVLAATFVQRPSDAAELLADVCALPCFLRAHPAVRLVVVDSVAFPFQAGSERPAFQTARLVALLLQALALAAAAAPHCAVVVTNHVTVKPATVHAPQPRTVPSLGEGFGHVCAVRLRLHWAEHVRCVAVDKGVPALVPRDAARALPFAVVPAGIRPTHIVES